MEKDEGEEKGSEEENIVDEREEFECSGDEEDWQTCTEGSESGDEKEQDDPEPTQAHFRNTSYLLHRDELLDVFKASHTGPQLKEEQITVGLVSSPPQGRCQWFFLAVMFIVAFLTVMFLVTGIGGVS